MGYMSRLDQQIVEMVRAGCKDRDIDLAISLEYNGLVSESLVREIVATARGTTWQDEKTPRRG